MSATYSPATIQRARTILARCESENKRTVERAVKQTKDPNAWKKFPASKSQMQRINSRYREMGLREFATLNAFRKVFPTMGDASAEYQSIKRAI